MGCIDEAALDRLSLVTQLSRFIRVRSAQQQPDGSPPEEAATRRASGGTVPAASDELQELGDLSPAFIWLLRDFFLDLEAPPPAGAGSISAAPASAAGQQPSSRADAYLEAALAPAKRKQPP